MLLILVDKMGFNKFINFYFKEKIEKKLQNYYKQKLLKI